MGVMSVLSVCVCVCEDKEHDIQIESIRMVHTGARGMYVDDAMLWHAHTNYVLDADNETHSKGHSHNACVYQSMTTGQDILCSNINESDSAKALASDL